MKVLTSSQMFSAEQAQVNRGMSFTRLMENAGSACARAVRERFASLEQSRGLICVLCGKGKNGGDGFVIARKLAIAGFNVAVVEAFGEPTAEDSILMREKAVETGLVPEFFWGEDNARKSIESAAVSALISATISSKRSTNLPTLETNVVSIHSFRYFFSFPTKRGTCKGTNSSVLYS